MLFRSAQSRFLDPAQLPRDAKGLAGVREADARVHALAVGAEQDADDTARATRYAQLIVNCAQCHSLHKRIWGPTRGH